MLEQSRVCVFPISELFHRVYDKLIFQIQDSYNNKKNVIIKHFNNLNVFLISSCEITECWINITNRNKGEWKTNVHLFVSLSGYFKIFKE